MKISAYLIEQIRLVLSTLIRITKHENESHQSINQGHMESHLEKAWVCGREISADQREDETSWRKELWIEVSVD